MRLGIATCVKCRELTATERPLISHLQSFGIEALPVVWNDPAVDWSSFDGILVRSIWDYHLHPDAYHTWLNRLDELNLPVWNPARVLRWNSHKFYLRDLASRGVDIVPTLFQGKGCTGGLDEAVALGWSDVVVKPAVSASGYRTHAISLSGHETRSILRDVSTHGDYLLQPFQASIRTSGELSLIFFDHEFSHAVLKRPREGDFRVQAEHGGKEITHTPDAFVIETAREILKRTEMPVLYARVDGIVADRRFLLMELELIEPDLFLGHRAGSDKLFAAHIFRRLRPSAS